MLPGADTTLDSQPYKKRNKHEFRATSIALEDTGVAVYNVQGPNLTKPTLAVAGMIVSVEARHAAWIRRITGKPTYGGSAANYPAPFGPRTVAH